MVSVYVKAFFISLIVFVLGLYTGMNIEKFVTSDLLSRTGSIESSVQEIELEMLYFQNLNESYACDFLNEIVRKTNNNLDILSDQISRYSEENVLITRTDIENLKEKYTFLLVKDWLLQERIKVNCGTKTVSVLYFYDRKGCDDCIVQGNILSSLKSSFKEKLMVFPLDIKVESSMLDILIKRFNITSVPSLVIEGKVYSGIVSTDNLKNIICDISDENITQCV